MCLAIPGKIISITETTASIDIEGNRVTADLSIVPDAVAGDWVIVHAGFVLQKYDAQEALKTLELLREAAKWEE